MHTKDIVMVHAVQVLMTTRRAFGLQADCHDPRIIMSFLRMCHRKGTVGEIRGISLRDPVELTSAQPGAPHGRDNQASPSALDVR